MRSNGILVNCVTLNTALNSLQKRGRVRGWVKTSTKYHQVIEHMLNPTSFSLKNCHFQDKFLGSLIWPEVAGSKSLIFLPKICVPMWWLSTVPLHPVRRDWFTFLGSFCFWNRFLGDFGRIGWVQQICFFSDFGDAFLFIWHWCDWSKRSKIWETALHPECPPPFLEESKEVMGSIQELSRWPVALQLLLLCSEDWGLIWTKFVGFTKSKQKANKSQI